MTTINFPLRTLNDSVIQDLKEKYPEAEIRVELHPNPTHTSLSEAHFWEIIDKFGTMKKIMMLLSSLQLLISSCNLFGIFLILPTYFQKNYML